MHKRHCSLRASSENICTVQTSHLARLTHVFTDVISTTRIHDALSRAAAVAGYLAEIAHLRGKPNLGSEMLSVRLRAATAQRQHTQCTKPWRTKLHNWLHVNTLFFTSYNCFISKITHG